MAKLKGDSSIHGFGFLYRYYLGDVSMIKREKAGCLCRNVTQDITIEHYIENPVIHSAPGITLVKDLNHCFVASNHVFSRFSGIEPHRLPTLNDSDMPWSERGHIYTDHEKDILAGAKYNVLEPLPGVVSAFLHTSKQVIYDKSGLPAGTIATAIIMNGVIDFHNVTGSSNIIKAVPYHDVNLNEKEVRVLFFILKGWRRKQISEFMNITTSNYDYCLGCIKRKFGVDSNIQLIEHCIESGYQDFFSFSVSYQLVMFFIFIFIL